MKDEGGKFLGLFFSLIFIVLMFIVGPFALIWAVSKLWNVAPVYDFWHWLAAAIITGMLGRAGSKGGDKS